MNDNYLTSAVVFAITLTLFGVALSLGAGMLAARGLFPEFSARCAERSRRPIRSLFLGLAVAIGAIILMGIEKALGAAGQIPMLVTGAGTFLLAVAGASGQMLRIARHNRQDGESPESWTALRRGAVVLSLSYLIPVAGTFVLLPASLLTGLGAAVLSLRAPRPASAEATPPPVPAPAAA